MTSTATCLLATSPWGSWAMQLYQPLSTTRCTSEILRVPFGNVRWRWFWGSDLPSVKINRKRHFSTLLSYPQKQAPPPHLKMNVVCFQRRPNYYRMKCSKYTFVKLKTLDGGKVVTRGPKLCPFDFASWRSTPRRHFKPASYSRIKEMGQGGDRRVDLPHVILSFNGSALLSAFHSIKKWRYFCVQYQ